MFLNFLNERLKKNRESKNFKENIRSGPAKNKNIYNSNGAGL